MRFRCRYLALVVLSTTPLLFASGEDPAAQAHLFLDKCASCHTVGGGEAAGPDLIASTGWPAAELRVAVKRMEENTGPLTDDEVDALVELLKNSDVKQVIAAAEHPQSAPAEQSLPAGDATIGRALFFGKQSLSAGGSPCFACHAVSGEGGTLARDLTAVHARMGETALLSATQKPGFPLMKASYARYPVTRSEAEHLVAFLRSGGVAPAATQQQAVLQPALFGAGGAIALVALALLAFALYRRRPARQITRRS